MGGSYYLEKLTDDIAEAASLYIDRIDSMGGTLAAIEAGFMQREIQNAAYDAQKKIESGAAIVVGVNKFQDAAALDPPVFRVNPAIEKQQIERVRELRALRAKGPVQTNLDLLDRAARGSENLMPLILSCCESKATVGEISDVLKRVFGEYREA